MLIHRGNSSSSMTDLIVTDALIDKFKKGMILKDRKYLGKVYPNSFVGKEAVDWLMFNCSCQSRKNAIKLGNDLMEKKVFEHVVGEHNFKDKDLFYKLIIDTTPSSPKNLFSRLGGKSAIASVVDDFVDRIKGNKVLLANPNVKEAFDRVSGAGLKFSIIELVCMATGGPQSYTGTNMRESHFHLKVTEAEWVAFAEDFKATLDKFKVPETETKELFTIVESLKDDIVTGDTLYSRLGGVTAIAAVVDDFLERIANNPILNANPHLKKANEHVSMPAFKYLVTEMVGMATGGPQKYSGKSMKTSHKHLQIREKEWEAFAGDFKITLDKFKVPSKEQVELFTIVGSLKGDIVQPAARSLYDRLGGFYGIATVVDDFIDRMLTDYTLNSNPALKEINAKTSPPLLKYSVTELVCQVTGGPQKYTGASMKDSHKNMKINNREWTQFVALFKQTMDKYQVPVPEQTEIVGIVATLKNDIVTA